MDHMIIGFIAMHSCDLEVQPLISMPCILSSTYSSWRLLSSWLVYSVRMCVYLVATLIGSALSLRVLLHYIFVLYNLELICLSASMSTLKFGDTGTRGRAKEFRDLQTTISLYTGCFCSFLNNRIIFLVIQTLDFAVYMLCWTSVVFTCWSSCRWCVAISKAF